MKEFDLFGFEVEIDEAATGEWYEKADEWNCECEDCRHFIDLAKKKELPIPVMEKLEQFGIVPEKATYVCEMITEEHKVLYQFSYRMAGTIVKERKDGAKDFGWGEVYCGHEPYPHGAPGFPGPHFDLEFWVRLPKAYKYSDIADFLMHGREIEFAYKGRKYSITNHFGFWHLCDDTENILLDTVCRFEEKEVLVSKIAAFVIDDMTIREIFDKQVYDIKGIDIISNKPSVTGIVEEVHGDYFIMYSETAEGYPNGSRWSVSLNTENKDSYTDVVVGDEIVMYYDGMAMETDPLQVSKVYAITLKTPASQTTLIANPWTNWDSIEEAESVIGFSFGLPEVIADSYNAVSIRTLNNELIEVVYRDGDFEIRIRKQKGEGQDISGDYNKYETCTKTNHNGGTIANYHNSNNNAVKQLISYKGYSWSLVAPNGYWGDSNWDFIGGIFL